MVRNIRALAVSVFVGLLLAGCDTVRGFVDTRGVEAVQESLQTAEDTICRYAPVGGVVRRYGASVETSRAWVQLCLGAANDGSNLVGAIETNGALPAEVNQ
jgi:hypothetical protein